MLSHLLDCLDGAQPYTLNDEVFAEHQANFRTAVLREALRRVGVEVADDRTTPQIEALLQNELNGLYARAATVIDDLADRRNQAAHGDEIELLDRATLRAVVTVVTSYADAPAEDAFNHLAGLLVAQLGAEIGLVQHTWAHPGTGLRTICRVAPAVGVACGQRILVRGEVYRLATVQSIQLDHVAVEDAGPSGAHHGVDIGTVAHDGERLYAVPGDRLDLIEGLVSPA